jgi:acetyl esterase/lipase
VTGALVVDLLIVGAAVVAGLLVQAGIGHGTALDRLRRGPDLRVPYKAVSGDDLRLDIFRARGPRPSAQAPLLLLVHGGGWETGDSRQFHPQCRIWSARGLDCVTLAYRVRSRHGSTPADALQDLRDAVRHLRRHHRALGLAMPRLVVGGGSAGGHLAAGLAAPLPWPDPQTDPAAPTRPDAVVLYNPMLDLSPGMPDHAPVAAHWQALSPMHQLRAGGPPTLVMSGDRDPEVAVATVERYVARLRTLGVPARAVIYPGAVHGFFNPGAWPWGPRQAGFEATTDEVWRFLAEQGWVPAGG